MRLWTPSSRLIYCSSSTPASLLYILHPPPVSCVTNNLHLLYAALFADSAIKAQLCCLPVLPPKREDNMATLLSCQPPPPPGCVTAMEHDCRFIFHLAAEGEGEGEERGPPGMLFQATSGRGSMAVPGLQQQQVVGQSSCNERPKQSGKIQNCATLCTACC